MVPGIRVLGWEGDLVSRDVGLCLHTEIILLYNTATIKEFIFSTFHDSVKSTYKENTPLYVTSHGKLWLSLYIGFLTIVNFLVD